MTGPDVPDIERCGWKDHANCRGCTDLFYAGRGQNDVSDAAKTICATCPVQVECLDHALTTGERHGVWGGTTALERRDMRNTDRAAVA